MAIILSLTKINTLLPMRITTLLLGFLASVFIIPCRAQIAEPDYMDPEGAIINYRTLTWSDFVGKVNNKEPYTGAAVRPSIYMHADSFQEHPENRLTCKFTVKCAFQSVAWARESVKNDRTYFYLNHEQEHYDIALTYANLLKTKLSNRDYGTNDYEKVISDIYDDMMRQYYRTQEAYDSQSDHSLVKEMQTLWDMRIKKCLENNTDEFYNSPLDVVKSVHYLVQNVKRLPNEPTRLFLTRGRPIYSEFTDELGKKVMETKEWSTEKAIVAFYSQQYVKEAEDQQPIACTRLVGDIFFTKDRLNYKRTLIDSFTNEDKPTTIVATFFANADTDAAKELVIITSAEYKGKAINGKKYKVSVYDNIPQNMFPARLKRLDDVNARLESGVDGYIDGKPSKAKFKTQQDVEAEFKKWGYN